MKSYEKKFKQSLKEVSAKKNDTKKRSIEDYSAPRGRSASIGPKPGSTCDGIEQKMGDASYSSRLIIRIEYCKLGPPLVGTKKNQGEERRNGRKFLLLRDFSRNTLITNYRSG